MYAQQLRSKIVIQSLTSTRDEIGQPINEWQDVATVWANIRYLSGTESIKADAEASVARASIRIRYRTGLTAAMRVKHGDTVYQIKAVLPDEARREHVDLVCEVVNGGA